MLMSNLTQVESSKSNRRRWSISIFAILMGVILAIVLILLGERIIFDLNRVANPLVRTFPSEVGYHYHYGYKTERSGLSPAPVYYPLNQESKYLLYKTFVHAAFIIPLFLLIFILYYFFKIKKKKEYWKIALGSYVAFGGWMMLHLLIDLSHYIVKEYRDWAVYIILGILVIIFTPLAVFLQKKFTSNN